MGCIKFLRMGVGRGFLPEKGGGEGGVWGHGRFLGTMAGNVFDC